MTTTTTARPGGRNPDHLWLADDEEKLVVSVLAPEVAGDAGHDKAGPITIVSPCPVTVTGPGGMRDSRPAEVGLHTPRTGGARIGWAGAAGSVAVAAGGAWAAGPWAGLAVATAGVAVTAWQALRRYTRTAQHWTEGHVVVGHYDDRDVIRRAAQNVRATAAAWPRLRAHVALDDPSPVLVTQLWDLALVVANRGIARHLRHELTVSGAGVPTGSATALELTDRIAAVEQDLAQLDEDIRQRQTYLWQLAHKVRAFVDEQEALARARVTIQHADQQAGISVTDPAVNAASDLAEHTSAVLAAYRELTNQPAVNATQPGQ
ncbi:hypothetical protein O7627_27630 [Solwaraspora sp. WMMD1047]|uniref:hypothetical protein n=1 Tax=Solwaraspora sp. WMMD1047 TaxID=3016102 RepID=UPI002416FA40|nr:hypothetical protein [Solwaraspora sp. WMMD1047]MDG4833049.1 hypothetical protein [Solwaraspora sp. WMMD1047]